MADTLGLVMLANGDDPAKVTDESFARAIETLQNAVDSGQIRQFYRQRLRAAAVAGRSARPLSWSGDVVQLMLDNKNLKWVICPRRRHHLDRQHADPDGRRRASPPRRT